MGKPNRRRSEKIITTSGQVQTWMLLAAVAAPALLVGPAEAVDGIMSIKIATVALIAVAVSAVATVTAARTGRLALSPHPTTWAALALAAVYLLAVVLSPESAQSFFGLLPRYSGFILYGSCVLLFVFGASGLRPDQCERWLRGMTVVGGLLGLLALAEALGMHDFGGAELSGVRATLGNPNFLAGWAAVASPLGVAVALDVSLHRGWRVAGGVTAALLIIAALGSRSLQGPVAAAAALSVLFLVWGSDRLPKKYVVAGAGGLLTLAVTGVVLGALGLTGTGPLASLQDDPGMEHRLYYWDAALSMVADSPLTGVGPSQFGAQYRAHRPLEDALSSPLTDSADSAHSVPLEMAASGGIPLALLHLAWVALVTYTFARGLRRQRGERKLLVAALGAAWTAYLLQSLVSIDVPPLAALGWVIGGLVVAASSDRPGAVHLPRRFRASRARTGASVNGIAVAALAAIALIAAWVVTLQVRADSGSRAASADRSGALASGTGVARAIDLAPWEPEYRRQLVRSHAALGDVEAALAGAVQAVADHPRDLDSAISGARLARNVGDGEQMKRLYLQALEIEPKHPALAVEAAEAAIAAGQTEWAEQLVADVLSRVPHHAKASRLADELAGRGPDQRDG